MTVHALKKSYDTTISTENFDNSRITPPWFRLLERIGIFTSFTNYRRSTKNYTFPLPQFLYNYIYKKPLTMLQRASLLNVIQKNKLSSNPLMITKIRHMKIINQHYKKELAALLSNMPNDPYKELYEMGLGSEFAILSSHNSSGKIEETILSIRRDLETVLQFDSLHRHKLSLLKSSINTAFFIVWVGYLAVVYITFFYIDAEFSNILFLFKLGYYVLSELAALNFLPMVLYLITCISSFALFKILEIDTIILLSMKRIKSILLFFDKLKFIVALNINYKANNITERTAFERSISVVEIESVRRFLYNNINSIPSDKDVIREFFLQSQFLDEEEIVHLIDLNKTNTSSSSFRTGLSTLLETLKNEAIVNRDIFVSEIDLVCNLFISFSSIFCMGLFLISDLQYISMTF